LHKTLTAWPVSAARPQVLASLNHPNIAAIYDVEERVLILELVEAQPEIHLYGKGVFCRLPYWPRA
jgi:hypothetical protein